MLLSCRLVRSGIGLSSTVVLVGKGGTVGNGGAVGLGGTVGLRGGAVGPRGGD